MKEISSKDNKYVKLAAALSEKKYRDEQGLYVIEGPNLIREALDEGAALRFIFISVGAESSEIIELAQEAEKKVPAVYQVSGEVFSRMTATMSPQGILAVAEKKTYSENAFFERCKGKCILVLDRLQDPGNLGSLLRTAEAAGFAGVLLLKGCADPYGPKTARAAAGSLFRLPLYFASGPKQALTLLMDHGKLPLTASMEGTNRYYDLDLTKDIALIIGNEGNGAAPELLSSCRTVTIPMEGRIESLNAALSGAIIMYESKRQRDLLIKNGGNSSNE